MSEIQTRHPVRLLTIDNGHAGQRIDNFLITILKGVPKSRVYRLLRTGQVRVNKGRIKPIYRLQLNDIIRIPPIYTAAEGEKERPSKGLCEVIQQAIIYEDDDLMIIDKPSGIAVHGGSGVQHGVIEIVRVMRPAERDIELAHRLDRQTSGALMLAKNRATLLELHELLRENRIDKRYYALVQGYWREETRAVDLPLVKDRSESAMRVVRVADGGQASSTHFSVVRRFDEMTLLEAKPLTGRMHQIRVHAAHLGHPIVGDELYGKRDLNRQLRKRGMKRLFLHAHTLNFSLSDKLVSPHKMKKISIEAPLSRELVLFLALLEK